MVAQMLLLRGRDGKTVSPYPAFKPPVLLLLLVCVPVDVYAESYVLYTRHASHFCRSGVLKMVGLTGKQTVTIDTGVINAAQFSPDGTRIVYLRRISGSREMEMVVTPRDNPSQGVVVHRGLLDINLAWPWMTWRRPNTIV